MLNTKNIICIFFSTLLLLFFTNPLWLERKPLDISLNINGNGIVTIAASTGQKTKKQELNLNKTGYFKDVIKHPPFFGQLGITLYTDNEKIDNYEISSIKLRKGKVKLDNFDNYKITGGNLKIEQNKLIITPTSNVTHIYYSQKIRPTIVFNLAIFLLILFLPTFIILRYKNEIFDILINTEIKKYIFNNKKTIILSLMLAVVLTFLTPHWWLNSDYWTNAYSLQNAGSLYVTFDNPANVTNKINFSRDVKTIQFTAETQRDVFINLINNKYLKFYILFNVYPDNYISNIQIKTNANGNLKLNFGKYTTCSIAKKIIYSKLNINNKDYLPQIINNQMIELKAHKGSVFNIQLEAKQLTEANINKFNYINPAAILFSIIIYFALLNYILANFSTQKFIRFIKFNKIPLTISFFFFIFYLILNIHAILNINLLKRDWILFGDSNYHIYNIFYNTTKRFHPFANLALYPFFDIISIFTKNIILNLSIIYAFITSLTIFFFNKITNLLNSSLFINSILTLILGFSYCFIVFSYSFDVYILTALYLTIILYCLILESKKLTTVPTITALIGILAALSFGVTFSNIITIIILLTGFSFIKRDFKQFYKLLFTIIILVLFFVSFKGITCNGNAFKHIYNAKQNKETVQKFTMNFNLENNVQKFYKRGLLQPISADNNALAVSFLLSSTGLIIYTGLKLKQTRSRQESIIFYTLLTGLLYNFCANCYWYPSAAFLFSLNYITLWFVIVAFCLRFIDKTIYKKIICDLLTIFLLCLIYSNYNSNKYLQNSALKQHPLIHPILMEINK